MPLVIEDGTGVANANSYIDVAYLRAFCGDRGVPFPAAEGDDALTIALFTPYLILATDYLESLRERYIGIRVDPLQALSWPRQHAFIGWHTMLPSNTIPERLKKAQAQLCVEQMRGIPLMTSVAGLGVGTIPDGPGGAVQAADGRFVVRDKVDVLETEWSQIQGNNITPIMPAVTAFLGPLLADGQQFITGVRI